VQRSRLQVSEVKGEDVICRVKNSATLSGPLYTLHVSQIRIDSPTLTDKDKEVMLVSASFAACTSFPLPLQLSVQEYHEGLVSFQ